MNEVNSQLDVPDPFLRRAQQWETHVTHQMKRLKISVAFPASKPPRHSAPIEGNRQRSHDFGKRAQVLPDGRWQVSWETHRRRLY